MKVFISSTYVDLIEYRKAAIEVVNRYKCVPLSMEFFGSQPQDPETVCENEIRACDVFIGLYAHRFGYVPGGGEKSITQQEYELAKELGKDCLCFIVDKSYPWLVTTIEMDKYPKLEKFLENVKKDNVVDFFKSPDNFSKGLSTSLGNLLRIKEGEASGKEVSCYIPLAPAPYIAHPYPLPDHFTGRDAERAALSNWLLNETTPAFVIEAIGGMGKSALSWAWLRHDVLDRSVEVDGVIWWSFYDGPFDSFIRHLACYVMGDEDIKSIDLPKLLAILQHRRFLLVLDGLERALRSYTGMEAMFIQEKKFEGKVENESERDKRLREPVHPWAGRFLQAVSSGNTRTLITTRLMPVPLEGLSGVRHTLLKGLSPVEAVRFFRSEGVKGSRAELEQAGKVYDYHPLMLKLLTSSIKRSRAKDIADAFRLNLIDWEEPHKILTGSFNLLSEKEKHVASSVSIFRSVFTFDSAKALFPDMDEEEFWLMLQELRNLGFLFYSEKDDCFGFHPIIRSFLYNNLTNRTEVHTLAVKYYRTLPKKEKIITLDDLVPVIELYYHLVKAERFNEACRLFFDRINEPIYSQLSAYYLIRELLKELFPDGEDRLPRLEKKKDQAETLNDLACTYSLSGQPFNALPLFFSSVRILEENNEKKFITIALGNVAKDQFRIGQIFAATVHFRKENLIGREIGYNMETASSYLDLGRVLAYQGRAKLTKMFNPPVDYNAGAEDEFDKSIIYCEEEKKYPGLTIGNVYRSLSAILQARLTGVLPLEENHAASYNLEALEQARQALAISGKRAVIDHPVLTNFVRAYWLLGEALIQCWLSRGVGQLKSFEIQFYDEPFQRQVELLVLGKGNELPVAERCINESLRRCRKVNMVELEPDILLALTRLEWVKEKPPDEKILKEAMNISLRSGYRLKLADIHLFCGQVLLEKKEFDTLLGLNAKEHLRKAKEYALDVSEFSHLYRSEDPHFYDNIPEYEILKRGMTKEERIRNGYWAAYKIADELEKRLDFNTTLL